MSSVKILLKHEKYAVVDKPSGILMHRSEIAPDRATLIDRLRVQFGCEVYLVHRLDRQTSGACLITFDAETASRFQKIFARRTVQKTYVALLRRAFPDVLEVDRPLTGDDGKKRDAKTSFRCIERFTDVSLVQAEPHTGRRHQIRRHLAHSMHHIIGDTTYGKGGINRDFRARYDLYRLFLHAERLEFTCPFSETPLIVSSALPVELARVISALRSDRPNP